jgi:hypothetical protein
MSNSYSFAGGGSGGGVTEQDITDALSAHLAADTRYQLREAFAVSGRHETRNRLDCGNVTAAITSGTLNLIPIWLPSGLVVNNISFVSGSTAGASLTNQWFALFNSARLLLAITTNDTSTAWGSGAVKTLNVATVASGAAASFTTTYTGVHYLGLMVAATTPPTISGAGLVSAGLASATPGVGGSNTGQTTPPAFPFTANAPSTSGPLAYAYVA